MADETTVINHPSWTHFVVYIAILALTGLSAGYCGYYAGKMKGALVALKQNPPNVYNAPTTVDQSIKKAGYMFGLHLGKAWGLGICHD